MDEVRGPVIVIVGPTGSGKTGLSIEVAKWCIKELGREVEIISADSRAIYEGMDIGTAKPNMEERDGVVHWGFDIASVSTKFNVSDFKKYALDKIVEIENRGNIPMVVGGTGLYVDAVIYNYSFDEDAKKMCSDREKMSTKFIVFGIKWDMEKLRERLQKRLSTIFTQELMGEVTEMVKKYGWENPAMKSNVYKFAWGYMNGIYSREDALKLAAYADYHLAKRQMTWFKRNEQILWGDIVKTKENVIKYIQDEFK